MNNQTEKTYIEEVIRVIRPTTSNHIFNDERYERIESHDADGLKTVLLREKSVDNSGTTT